MLAKHWWRAAAAGVSLVALTLLVTCSSKNAQDGDSCSANGDCASSRCGSIGTCEGSDCTCQGADCRGQSSCKGGWLCTRTGATTFDAIPQCRQQCGDTIGACPSNKHCDNGICLDGPEAFSLSWANLPRKTPCAPMVPCEYKLNPPAIPVDTYTWDFGADGGTMNTTAPSNTFTFPQAGTYDVSVGAHATTGATTSLMTTEVLCDGQIGDGCDPLGAPCCTGGCSAQLICK
ncbi:MAG: hypothetical protein QOI41_1755 [Myxococcales bacterium]|nr:hypothetical protein [Myxococcales bacterium]